MKKRLLLLHSSTDGHTVRICERLRGVVEPLGPAVAIVPVAQAAEADLAACDAVAIGASIRYGRHKPEVGDFIERHRRDLESRPNAFFSVNVVARKPGKDRPAANPYLQRFLRDIAWKPQRLAVFAGRIDYPRYDVLDRTMIRFIMWMTRGPTDPTAVIEFTDWAGVDAFGVELAGITDRA